MQDDIEPQEPMTATEVKVRELLQSLEFKLDSQLLELENRVMLCERVFIKIMQLDARLDTLEFNSYIPVKPSAGERLLDFELRIERLESHLINGVTQ